jgi:hypothetical protein
LVLARYTSPKPVNRWSLRPAYVGATLAALLAVVSVQPALAHGDLRPALVEGGAVVDVRVELPRLRPGDPPERLELEAPGVEVLSVRRLPAGPETAWSVRLRAKGAPGVVPVVLRAVYADGQSVAVDQRLTVVPAAEESGFPWPAVVVGAFLAVAFAVAGLFLARRKA